MVSIRHAAVICCAVALSSSQCVNEVAAWNPNARTMASNITSFLLPVPRTAVQAALDKFYGPSMVKLADVPANDKSLFPDGFDATKYHPIYTLLGSALDTRMGMFQIEGSFQSASTIVPFVKRHDSGPNDILSAQLLGFVSGQNNQPVPGLVPALVSTVVEGYPLALGQFNPPSGAWQADQFGTLSGNAAWKVIPNPVSGPGVIINAIEEVFDTDVAALQSAYTSKLWRAMYNQPAILAGPALFAANMCQRNQYYFNNQTSVMTGRAGNVTLGNGADASLTNGSLAGSVPAGVFYGVKGFSACGQNVGFNPENCGAAVANVDRTAL